MLTLRLEQLCDKKKRFRNFEEHQNLGNVVIIDYLNHVQRLLPSPTTFPQLINIIRLAWVGPPLGRANSIRFLVLVAQPKGYLIRFTIIR